jgi:hypothetical protein
MYVKPLTIVDGRGAIDPDRRDQILEGVWRHAPENTYWRRLKAMGDVLLREEDDPPPEEEIEGYEAPAPLAAEFAAKTAEPLPNKPAVAQQPLISVAQPTAAGPASAAKPIT